MATWVQAFSPSIYFPLNQQLCLIRLQFLWVSAQGSLAASPSAWKSIADEPAIR